MLPTLTGLGLIIMGVVPIVLVAAAFKLEPQRKAFYQEIRAIPAQWKPEWSAGRLTDQTVETASVMSAMMIVLAGMSLFADSSRSWPSRQGAWAGLVMLVVPLILVGFVVARIRGSGLS